MSDPQTTKDDCDPDTPAARKAEREHGVPDQLKKTQEGETRQEALIDEAVEESFPASDPPSAKHIT